MSTFLRIAITNPNPGGGTPATVSNDLYRREVGGTWIRIATGLAAGATYDDYAVAHGVSYQYYVRGFAASGVTADSAISAAKSVTLAGAHVHDPSDPAGTHYTFQYDRGERGDRRVNERELVKLAGRANPVAVFGEGYEENVPLTLPMPVAADLAALRAFVARNTTLLYRDSAGRKVFCTTGGLDVDDLAPFLQSGSFEFDRVYFKEEV